jgi:glucose-6-phosphate 1-dehydrogenase
MAQQPIPTIPLEPAILVIFGVTGDLSKRYLLPALYQLYKANLLPEQTEIVGISRHLLDMDNIFQELETSLNQAGEQIDQSVLQRMREKSRPYQLDMDDRAAYAQLHETLNTIEEAQGMCMNRLYYLSIPPAAYSGVIERMGQTKLSDTCQHGIAKSRLLLEKPLGSDLASAQALIQTIAEAFDESQVFRIDHYLAKETVQNILTFRFENPLFEAIWNRDHVSKIDIIASEKIGIEGRAAFYEGQGALRDLIQNHLLQLLAVATMDKPAAFTSDGIHESKLQLLQMIQPVSVSHNDGNSATSAHRGQYQGYRDEVGDPASIVETFASVTTTINSPRWQGVPVTISTGKALAHKQTVVSFTFDKNGATVGDNDKQTNIIEFRIAPNEGIAVQLMAKKPGFDHELQSVMMDFAYADNFHGSQPSAYERVLLDAVRGDRTLFATSDEAIAAWQIVNNVVTVWQQNGNDLRIYQPGTPIDEL